MSKPKRAEPLAPDQRRRAIIEAVLPLLATEGRTATTKQMAKAAGVAEGTLFSVFPDKRALIRAAIEYRMDPEPLRRDLAAIEAVAPLEARLVEAGRVLVPCLEEISALMSVLHTMPPSGEERPRKPPAFVMAWGKAVNEAVASLLEPDRSRLRLPPAQVAEVFTSLLFSSSRPAVDARARLTAKEIVDVLLHGALDEARKGDG